MHDAGAGGRAIAGFAVLREPDEPDGHIDAGFEGALGREPRIERLVAGPGFEDDAARESVDEPVHIGGRVQRKESLAEGDPWHVRPAPRSSAAGGYCRTPSRSASEPPSRGRVRPRPQSARAEPPDRST